MTETFRERTNATQYQQRQRLPPNFSTVLKEYTREVLREQADDILAWSARYFKKLALESDPLLAQQVTPPEHSREEDNPEQEVVGMKISKILATMDQSGCGKLYVYLVKRAFMESLSLSRAQALYILSSEVSVIDDHAEIEYRKLARDAVPATLYFQQSGFVFPEVTPNDDGASVHGMIKDEVEETLLRACVATDVDCLGKIPFAEYKKVLENAPIDLTRRDIKVLLAEAEVTRESTIDIRTEVGKAFENLLLAYYFDQFDVDHQ